MIDQALIEKAAGIPGMGVLARAIKDDRPYITTDTDVSQLRVAGGVGGGIGGGLAGGLAGLLYRYTTADAKKRELKDYLKSILIGGGLGAGVGAVGLSAGLGALGTEMQSLEAKDPRTAQYHQAREFRNKTPLPNPFDIFSKVK